MDILYVAHCVPWPPDKGERIRSHNFVSRLADRHRVHLACIASTPEQATAVSPLRDRLASVRIAVLEHVPGLLRGALSLARGHSYTMGCYGIPALRAHVRAVIESNRIGAVILLSAATTPYAPDHIPFIADWGDVDSEKFLQYARMRSPGLLYRLEAHRLRQEEINYARRAARTFMTTPNEARLFDRIAPGLPLGISGNGVDVDYFDPRAAPTVPAELAGRNALVFMGTLNYFPNADGVCWFADTVYPALRRQEPDLELFLVGRLPTPEVLKLGERPGITVTGAVEDVRPYVAAARAAITPLRLARGVQNKVLEALAMGKRVLASPEVCDTFHPDLPGGVVPCASAEEYCHALAALPRTPDPDWAIVAAARRRFSWDGCVAPILAELDRIAQDRHPVERAA